MFQYSMEPHSSRCVDKNQFLKIVGAWKLKFINLTNNAPVIGMLFKFKKETGDQNYASAGNRTRVNCLEGSYANHYTTDALHMISLKQMIS